MRTSFAIAFAEWDCAGKQRLSRQITFYNSSQTVAATQKRGLKWSPIIPDSTADFLDHRICRHVPPVIKVPIVADRTALHTNPDDAASISRLGKRGKRFEIMPETGKAANSISWMP